MNDRLRDLAGDIPSLAGPHLDDRAIKALMIVVGGMPDVRIRDDIRLVPSATCGGAFYMTSSEKCTCDDFAFRRVVCKHRLAVRLAEVLETAGTTEGGVDVDTAATEPETLPF